MPPDTFIELTGNVKQDAKIIREYYNDYSLRLETKKMAQAYAQDYINQAESQIKKLLLKV